VNSDPTVSFEADRASPSPQGVEIRVLVQIAREPDVVVRAAVAVLHDVDVAVVNPLISANAYCS
jgi:hypothetical protein